jgi:hypothetical protein
MEEVVGQSLFSLLLPMDQQVLSSQRSLGKFHPHLTSARANALPQYPRYQHRR